MEEKKENKNVENKKKRICGLPDRVSTYLAGETKPILGLVQNVASSGLGFGGQGGAGDGRWCPISVVG